MRNYDVAIIGAGVTGCAIARHLSRFRLKVALRGPIPPSCTPATTVRPAR